MVFLPVLLALSCVVNASEPTDVDFHDSGSRVHFYDQDLILKIQATEQLFVTQSDLVELGAVAADIFEIVSDVQDVSQAIRLLEFFEEGPISSLAQSNLLEANMELGASLAAALATHLAEGFIDKHWVGTSGEKDTAKGVSHVLIKGLAGGAKGGIISGGAKGAIIAGAAKGAIVVAGYWITKTYLALSAEAQAFMVGEIQRGYTIAHEIDNITQDEVASRLIRARIDGFNEAADYAEAASSFWRQFSFVGAVLRSVALILETKLQQRFDFAPTSRSTITSAQEAFFHAHMFHCKILSGPETSRLANFLDKFAEDIGINGWAKRPVNYLVNPSWGLHSQCREMPDPSVSHKETIEEKASTAHTSEADPRIGTEQDVGSIYLSTIRGSIYRWNTASGQIKNALATGLPLTDIAFGSSGQLFGITSDSLYRINFETGRTELVGELRSKGELYAGGGNLLTSANGLDISPSGVGRITSQLRLVFEVDLSTGVLSTRVGRPLGQGGQRHGEGAIWFTDPDRYVLTHNGTLVFVSPTTLTTPGVADPAGVATGEAPSRSVLFPSIKIDAIVGAPPGLGMPTPDGILIFSEDAAYPAVPEAAMRKQAIQTFALDGRITGAAARRSQGVVETVRPSEQVSPLEQSNQDGGSSGADAMACLPPSLPAGWNDGKRAVARDLLESYGGDTGTMARVAEAAPYAVLAWAAYADPAAVALAKELGWSKIEAPFPLTRDRTIVGDLSATLFSGPGGAKLLAYRGTTPGVGDWVTNIGGTLSPTPLLNEQVADALEVAETVIREYPNVIFAGHSLGGRLAQAASLRTGAPAYAFNSAPVGYNEIREMGFADLRNGSTNRFRSPQDPLSGFFTPNDVVVANISEVDAPPLYNLINAKDHTHVAKVIAVAMNQVRVALNEGWIDAYTQEQLPTLTQCDAKSAVAIAVDVSWSMGDVADASHNGTPRKKIDIAKEGVLALSDGLDGVGAAYGLSIFAADATTLLEMGSGPSHLADLRGVVHRIALDDWTNVGAGLRAGFGQLNHGAGAGCLVLMSDGQHNKGGPFDDAVAQFKAKQWPVYTVGFGEEAGKAELQGIAWETGGTFWLAGARNLGSIFLDSGSLCTNTSTTKRVAETMGPGSEVEYTFAVQSGVSEIGGHATWQGSTLDVIMVDPRGRQIPSSALPAQDGQASTGSNYLVFSKRNPEPGTWRLRFFWSDPPPVAEQVNIALTERSDLVMALVGIENEYAVEAPVQIALLTGEVIGQERVPLQDPRMRVRVQKPGSQVMDVVRARSRNLQLLERVVDAATVTLEVHDDGQHEDYHPGDGIFGGVFTDTHEPGVYLVKAEVRGRKSDGSWVQREITATFQVGPLADNPVTAAEVLEIVDLLSQRQDPSRSIDAVRAGQIRIAPAPIPRPVTAPQLGQQLRPTQPSNPAPTIHTQPRPSQTGPAGAIERLRARE